MCFGINTCLRRFCLGVNSCFKASVFWGKCLFEVVCVLGWNLVLRRLCFGVNPFFSRCSCFGLSPCFKASVFWVEALVYGVCDLVRTLVLSRLCSRASIVHGLCSVDGTSMKTKHPRTASHLAFRTQNYANTVLNSLVQAFTAVGLSWVWDKTVQYPRSRPHWRCQI